VSKPVGRGQHPWPLAGLKTRTVSGVAISDRLDQLRALARHAISDLFDQRVPFGRLALVQVLMLAGDTLVTISLADSLFFSIPTHEATSKVLLYLLLTLAPFAVVAPLLGPLIDRSRGGKRGAAVVAAVGRGLLCPLMALSINSVWLFPEAFLILVLSKLYLVTRGALVPEMMTLGTAMRDASPIEVQPGREEDAPVHGYAALNARLTLLGTLAGFMAAVPGVPILKLFGAPGVLIFDTLVFAAAAIAAARLPVSRRRGSDPNTETLGGGFRRARSLGKGASDPDLASLQPLAEPPVLLGLTANSLLRGTAGFFVFMLAFGLRRLHASLFWYALALGASGAGSLLGLLLVSRLRRRLGEPQILLSALWLVAVVGSLTAVWGDLQVQGFLALSIGVAGSLGQPSFDSITQRYVPEEQQGRVFARFATRQQLVWVLGALLPVVIALPLQAGDVIIAATAALGGLGYLTSQRALHNRALPRQFRRRDIG
jgi:hypothetical protein